jgi:hypothetical protein
VPRTATNAPKIDGSSWPNMRGRSSPNNLKVLPSANRWPSGTHRATWARVTTSTQQSAGVARLLLALDRFAVVIN